MSSLFQTILNLKQFFVEEAYLSEVIKSSNNKIKEKYSAVYTVCFMKVIIPFIKWN